MPLLPLPAGMALGADEEAGMAAEFEGLETDGDDSVCMHKSSGQICSGVENCRTRGSLARTDRPRKTKKRTFGGEGLVSGSEAVEIKKKSLETLVEEAEEGKEGPLLEGEVAETLVDGEAATVGEVLAEEEEEEEITGVFDGDETTGGEELVEATAGVPQRPRTPRMRRVLWYCGGQSK